MAITTRTQPADIPAAAWLRRAGEALRRGWHAYWERRTQRATVLMLKVLDERTLHDIGIDRSEIESVVYGSPRERRHTYRCGGRG